MQEFLKNLNPLEDLTVKELSDYMYAKSLELEPRNARQLPKFVSRFGSNCLYIVDCFCPFICLYSTRICK